MSSGDFNLRELSTTIGAEVVAAEAGVWGFENRTVIVTLADTRRFVIQYIRNHALAPHKIQLARSLPVLFASAGLRTASFHSADANANPPFIVREYIAGGLAASLLDTQQGAVQVAQAMGALLPKLTTVATNEAALQSAWSNPSQLAQQAQQQLDRCAYLLDSTTHTQLASTIAAIPVYFADRPACFAHGDFCPVNALIANHNEQHNSGSALRIAALIDIELARIADPLFDAAWWGWVVRYHHPNHWLHAWPHLLAAAHIPNNTTTQLRIQALQQLRCLEMLNASIQTQPTHTSTMWVKRLTETVAWA